MKYALVTGASRGIGRAIAVRLAGMGYPVLINYKGNEQAAEQTAAMVREAGQTATLMCFDVSDSEAVNDALEAWYSAHPDDYIDVLVNNAGIRQDALLAFMEDEQWNSVINTTLGGFFHVTRNVIKQMVLNRHGRVINISSISGISGIAGQTNYSAAKAAMIGVVKSLSKEVASRKVTVNAVAPGFISTDMTAGLDETELKKTIPLGRFGKPEEVAALVAFLASEDAAYITGQVIAVSGGIG